MTPCRKGSVASLEGQNDPFDNSRLHRHDDRQFHLQRLRLERAVGVVRGSDVRSARTHHCSGNRASHGGQLFDASAPYRREEREELRRTNGHNLLMGDLQAALRPALRVGGSPVHVTNDHPPTARDPVLDIVHRGRFFMN